MQKAKTIEPRGLSFSRSRMRGADFVAFDGFAEFPAGHDVGDAAIFFHGADDDLGHKLAVAADKKFAVSA